ncbi:MAG TPA: hypothetical protein DD611_03980 [Alphaproteobacteria bacterium]|nr:hypothetical protein [Alphaproteobacteria bacterium]HBS76467.1 hypothetical protein [Alphaproteobacteria bacterium]
MLIDRIKYLLNTDRATRRADKNEYNLLFEKYIKTFDTEQNAYDHMTVTRVYEKNKPQMADCACRIEVTDRKTGQIRAVHDCVFFNRSGCGRIYCPQYDNMKKWTDARAARAEYAQALQRFWSDKMKLRETKGK